MRTCTYAAHHFHRLRRLRYPRHGSVAGSTELAVLERALTSARCVRIAWDRVSWPARGRAGQCAVVFVPDHRRLGVRCLKRDDRCVHCRAVALHGPCAAEARASPRLRPPPRGAAGRPRADRPRVLAAGRLSTRSQPPPSTSLAAGCDTAPAAHLFRAGGYMLAAAATLCGRYAGASGDGTVRLPRAPLPAALPAHRSWQGAAAARTGPSAGPSQVRAPPWARSCEQPRRLFSAGAQAARLNCARALGATVPFPQQVRLVSAGRRAAASVAPMATLP